MRAWPPATRRTWTEAFWRSLSLLLGSLGAVMSASFGVSDIWAVGVGVAVMAMLLLLGWRWPAIRMSAYQRWTRIRAWYQALLAFLVRRVVFFLVLRAVSLTGSRLSLTGLATVESHWVRRERQGQAVPSYLHEYRAVAGVKTPARGWARALSAWALRSDNAWIVCLVPFVAILAAVDGGSESSGAPPVTTYTLY